MATLSITGRLESADVQAGFRAWQRLGREPQPLLRAIGAGLVSNTQDRFDAGRDPQGKAWEEVKEPWASLKKGPGVLREAGMRGGLQGSITMDVSGDELMVGSNKIYAGVHQFGAIIRPKNGTWLVFRTSDGNVYGGARQVRIPARPYLGIGPEDEDTVLDVTEVFFLRFGRPGALIAR
ncbi:phage virion morphogenesis protein [Plastoroseomonas hellenica]|uniref:phage virion morphogenesis protein n=1 Tax=Plastoroseomonas hellenica TaxID=2687306 RepID=UPI001BA7A6B5|nr:phage virion morphogenesis protein [Plastoroseomonas hellenica]MBR0643996.1 phage virion morphogenesis protein [Plastoroseomonas hellenica]